jgi:hypothetical protein
MTSKLRIESPEAICHVIERGGQSERTQTPPQAQEVLSLCQWVTLARLRFNSAPLAAHR